MTPQSLRRERPSGPAHRERAESACGPFGYPPGICADARQFPGGSSSRSASALERGGRGHSPRPQSPTGLVDGQGAGHESVQRSRKRPRRTNSATCEPSGTREPPGGQVEPSEQAPVDAARPRGIVADPLHAAHDPRRSVRDPDTMAVVSGAAFSRASSSLTHAGTGDRRRPIRIHHAPAASNTTTTPANNPQHHHNQSVLLLDQPRQPHQAALRSAATIATRGS